MISSHEQMKLAAKVIDNLYNHVEDNIDIISEKGILKQGIGSVTKYIDNTETIKMTPSTNSGIESRIYNFFNDYASKHIGVKSIYIAYKDGGYVNWPETYVYGKYNPVDRDWYKIALEGDGEIIKLPPELDYGNDMVSSSVKAIKDYQGNIIGVLGIDVNDHYIGSILENMRIGETGFFILCDDNIIVADGRNEKNNFKRIEDSDIEGLKNINNLRDSEMLRVRINNEKYLFNHEKIGKTGFTIASLISEEEIGRYSITLNLIIIVLSLIIISIIIYINIVNINKLAVPIGECAEYLDKLGKGYFECDINPEYLTRKDEIGIISNGINEMKISLVSLIYEIKNELRVFKKLADESKNSCLLIYDDKYNIIYKNDLIKKYYRKDFEVGTVNIKKNTKDIFMPIDEKINTEIEEALKLHDVWNGTIEIDELKCIINCSVERIYNEEQKSMFTVVRFNDITEKLKAEKELIEYEKMKSQEILRSNFFANISHELRTPLNIFNSTIQLLDMKFSENSDDFNDIYLKYRKSLKTNCQRMLRLINNIVDITKIDVGFKDVKFANYDIVQVVEEITLSVVNYAQNKKINVVFDTEVEEHIIKCDFDMIERIMLNLLSNAIKFTNVEGNIMVDMYVDEEWVHIKVKDDGIGIPLEIQKNIFDRFVQSDKSLTRLNEGSGIGLAIVKSLVKLSEGEIYLQSDGKKGTEFEILLPNKRLEDADEYNIVQEVNVKNTELELSDIYELQ